MLNIGDVVDDNEIINPRGEGSFGRVFEVRKRGSSQLLALKEMKEGSSSIDEDNFRLENVIQAGLDHKNILKVLSQVQTWNKTLYYLMELADISLEDFVNTDKSLSEREKLDVFIKICEAVSYAHDNSTVHRDLHWGNILLKHEQNVSEPKVTDFGRAKNFSLNFRTLIPLSKWGIVYITPPEVHFRIWDKENLNNYILSDVYALGMVIYFILYGEPSFYIAAYRKSILTFLATHQINQFTIASLPPSDKLSLYNQWLATLVPNFVESFTPISSMDLKLQQSLRSILNKMLSLDFAKRFSNVKDVISAVRSI